MKHLAVRLLVSLFTFVIGIAAAQLLPTSRHHAAPTGADAQAILQMERQYIQAHLNRDTATLDNILADDFTLRSRWRSTTKAERLAQLEDSDFAFVAINTDNVDVEVSGDHAVVTGDAFTRTLQGDLEVTSPVYSFARSYEKRDGRWQIVSVRTGCR